MKTTKTLMISSLVLALASGAALADDGKGKMGKRGMGMHGPRPEFSDFDSNGDGQVTAAEIQAFGDARFAAIDTDGNGEISAAEFAAKSQSDNAERAQKMVDRFDADKSGGVSKDEMPKPRDAGDRVAKMIERFDTNGDGQISQEEFAAHDKRGKRGGKRDKDDDAMGGASDGTGASTL